MRKSNRTRSHRQYNHGIIYVTRTRSAVTRRRKHQIVNREKEIRSYRGRGVVRYHAKLRKRTHQQILPKTRTPPYQITLSKMTLLLTILLILTSVWAVSATIYAIRINHRYRNIRRDLSRYHYNEIDKLKKFASRYRTFVISIDTTIKQQFHYIDILKKYD